MQKELIKKFAAVSDMFDSDWDGIAKKKRVKTARGKCWTRSR